MLQKLQGVWNKFDGLKSFVGLLMIAIYYMVPQYTSVHIPDLVLKLGMAWAGVGIAHKLEKAMGILTMVLTALEKAAQAGKSVLDAVSKSNGGEKK